MTLLGVEIGGTKLQFVVGDETGRIHERQRLRVDVKRGGEGIREQIASTWRSLSTSRSFNAMGVGFGGPVDWRTGIICCSHQIEGWAGFPLGEWLRDLTRVPVFVDNDANVATLGEARHGAARGFNPVFWINMGSGVGGGLVVDGRLYHGARPGEVEIGHVRLDKSGVTLEDRCAGWAVDRRIREAIATDPSGLLARLTKGASGGEARSLAPAVAGNDPSAQAILSQLGDDLAFALSHVVQLFHPEIIVMGGGLSLVGEPLRAAVAAALPAYVMDSFQPGPRIALAGLREDSVPIGALTLAADGVQAVR